MFLFYYSMRQMVENKFDDSLHLVFSFKLLKNYIKSRYKLVNQVTKWCKNEIEKYNIYTRNRPHDDGGDELQQDEIVFGTAA